MTNQPGSRRTADFRDLCRRTSPLRRGKRLSNFLDFAMISARIYRSESHFHYRTIHFNTENEANAMGLFDKLKQGLQKTKQLLQTDIRDVFKPGELLNEEVLLRKSYTI